MRRRQARTTAQARADAPACPRPAAVSGTEMAAAAASGQAAPFSQAVAFLMRYQHTWWLGTQAGWLPVPPPVDAILDEHATRLRHHEAMTAANQTAIRAVINLARDATTLGRTADDHHARGKRAR